MANADNTSHIETFYLSGDQSVPLPRPTPGESLSASSLDPRRGDCGIAGQLLVVPFTRQAAFVGEARIHAQAILTAVERFEGGTPR